MESYVCKSQFGPWSKLSPKMASGYCKCIVVSGSFSRSEDWDANLNSEVVCAVITFPQETRTSAQCASPGALIKKALGAATVRKGSTSGIKCRLCSTALSVRDAKHVSAAAEGVLLRTISGLYSTAEHQPRGASMRLCGTARRSSRLYSTARR